MKLLTKEQEDGLWKANINGGLKGAAWATGLSVPGVYALQRYSPSYRALPLPLKAFGVVVVSVPLIVVNAEKAGERYEQSLWTGVGKREMDAKAAAAQEKWEGLSTYNQAKQWAKENRYKIVGGTWILSLAAAGLVISRNKYLTFPQKLVQARMFAQFTAVGMVIAGGVMAGVSTTGEKAAEEEPDHSWADILRQEELDEKAKSVRLPSKDTSIAHHAKAALK